MSYRIRFLPAAVLLISAALWMITPGTARSQVSDQPDTPFKLATFEATGTIRIGMAVQASQADRAGQTDQAGQAGQEKLMDLHEANAYVTRQLGLPVVSIPKEMRTLIEQYDAVSNRMYTIANYMGAENRLSNPDLPFVFDPENVSFKAPIKYPYNLLAAAANYRAHADEMEESAIGGAGFTAVEVDVDAEEPYFFAKSPRSTIIDPGEPYYVPKDVNIDWEVELAIIIGRPALDLTLENAHDYVFGYSIIFDVSRRGGSGLKPINRMFPGPNWFNGKSSDRAAPFGPYIVPKEFIQHDDLEIKTWVNGVIKQDSNTSYMIYDEAHMIRYLTSVQTLYPGDVIATGTPDGVGRARNPPEYLQPGDVVEMEIEGIGRLVTPMEAKP